MTTYTYTTLNDLSSTATDAEGINRAGQIVGEYYYNGSYHGFLYSDGNYTTIDFPLAITTIARGINDAGQIVGYYVDSNSITHGFLYNNGSYSTIDDPLGVSTNVEGINDAGQIVGYYVDSNTVIHGFVYSGGSYITLDDPLGYATIAEGINDLGQVVGYYFENNGTINSPIHGFLYSGGTYTTIDDPAHPTETILRGIDDAGQIVGYSADSNSSGLLIHSFLLRSGNYTTIDDPLGTTTVVQGINDVGQIVGFYYNTDNISHSFVAAPAVIGTTLPVPLQQDVVIQNDTTGQVDYLKFVGTTLLASSLHDYGLGSAWKIVASDSINGDAFPDLVAQNQATGQVDFLFLDGNANLIGSALGSAVPHIVGFGFDFGTVPGQAGHTMVSQLPDGQLDFLAFNASATLIASDLIPGTTGLPHAVGIAAGNASPLAFSGLGNQDAVVTQLADGSVDFIGFNGSFANQTLAYVASYFVPGSAGTPPIGSVNQNIATNFNERDASGTEGIHTITQLASGQLDAVFFDSGINDTAHRGTEYASTLFNSSFPGWHVVDGGLVAHNDLFPIV